MTSASNISSTSNNDSPFKNLNWIGTIAKRPISYPLIMFCMEKLEPKSNSSKVNLAIRYTAIGGASFALIPVGLIEGVAKGALGMVGITSGLLTYPIKPLSNVCLDLGENLLAGSVVSFCTSILIPKWILS